MRFFDRTRIKDVYRSSALAQKWIAAISSPPNAFWTEGTKKALSRYNWEKTGNHPQAGLGKISFPVVYGREIFHFYVAKTAHRAKNNHH